MTKAQERAAFTAAILAGDDAARMVFADWLDGHGEAEAATALRLDGRFICDRRMSGYVASWLPWGAPWHHDVARLGPVHCRCGERAFFYRTDLGPWQWFCHECNSLAQDRRWRREQLNRLVYGITTGG